MELAIVTTTINVPTLFEGYCRDFAEHKRKGINFIVIADKKTPPAARTYCEQLQATYGYSFEYMDVEDQVSYLKRFPELDAYLPYNSVQRRNIGMLRAYEIGAQAILTVDDDNFVLEPDLLQYHLKVGQRVELPALSSSNQWLDPCQFLTATPQMAFYHRGFPMAQRWQPTETTESTRTARVIVNVGMWVGDPDVDAWVRLTVPLEAIRWNKSNNFTLAPGTWAPFNSQQTTLARDLIPAYFLNPNAGRYDDIWASFIVHRFAEHFDDAISYGSPVVSHLQKRSLASLWHDLGDERMGVLLNTHFIDMLRTVKLTGSSYAECYAELAAHLRCELETRQIASKDGVEYLREYIRGMDMWLQTFGRLGGQNLPNAQPAVASGAS